MSDLIDTLFESDFNFDDDVDPTPFHVDTYVDNWYSDGKSCPNGDTINETIDAVGSIWKKVNANQTKSDNKLKTVVYKLVEYETQIAALEVKIAAMEAKLAAI